MGKHADWFRAEQLLENERVLAEVEVQRANDLFDGALILSDQRIAFVRKGAVRDDFEAWRLDEVTGIAFRKGAMLCAITVRVADQTLELRTFDKPGAIRLTQALQDRLDAR